MSNSNIAIKCENVGKRYYLGEESDIYTITEFFTSTLRSVFLGQKQTKKQRKEFWALQDVSFELEKGKTLACIGRNGSGKSTLLKILSRITPPSKGQFGYNGSISSLLEVGTGFKQELTGRDNIFLSGTLLGLKKADIERRLDDIIEFAEIENFIDTPVKRYSSGMYVRLAFAVAAHLEPEILLIDEVLAVGDIKFQKKCLEKMGDVVHEGRTVIFVSHNMQAVATLCQSALLLDYGEMITKGPVSEVISAYHERMQVLGKDRAGEMHFEEGDNKLAWIRRICLKSEKRDEKKLSFDIMEGISFEMEYEVKRELDDIKPYLIIKTLDGMVIISSCILDPENMEREEKQVAIQKGKGRYLAKGHLPVPLLNTGFYEFQFFITATHHQLYDLVDKINVEITDYHASFASCIDFETRTGLIVPKIAWSEEKL